MTDIFTKEKRSWIMSRIRSKDTKIEKTIEQKLSESEIPFKKHYQIFGKPDFVLKKERIAIFCDSDFWHGKIKNEKFRRMNEFWKKKILKNVARDKKVNSTLKKEGWKIIRLNELEITKHPEKCIRKIKIPYHQSFKNFIKHSSIFSNIYFPTI